MFSTNQVHPLHYTVQGQWHVLLWFGSFNCFFQPSVQRKRAWGDVKIGTVIIKHVKCMCLKMEPDVCFWGLLYKIEKSKRGATATTKPHVILCIWWKRILMPKYDITRGHQAMSHDLNSFMETNIHDLPTFPIFHVPANGN
jgi:hypothetical protein